MRDGSIPNLQKTGLSPYFFDGESTRLIIASGLARFATKLPLAAFPISMLMGRAFVLRCSLGSVFACLALFRLKGLTHALFNVFVISHIHSVAPDGGRAAVPP